MLIVRVALFFDDECVYIIGAECVQSGLRKKFAGLQFLENQGADRKRTAEGQIL